MKDRIIMVVIVGTFLVFGIICVATSRPAGDVEADTRTTTTTTTQPVQTGTTCDGRTGQVAPEDLERPGGC